MAHIFKSERLLYIPMEKNEKLDKFWLELEREPSTLNANPTLYTGTTPAKIEELHKFMATKLLAMYVCLPGSASASSSAEPTPIGIVSISKPMEIQRHHSNGAVGAILSSAHQGKGYGSEAIRWAMWWGFTMAGLHRLEIRCFGFNKGAFRLYQRLGFKHEGTSRECIWFMGAWHDSYELGIIDREWKALRKEQGKDDEMDSDKVAEIMGSK